MSVSPPASSDAAARALVLRHVSTLINKALAFFAQHQDEQLKMLRTHLFERVDARPPAAQAQNLRSAGMLLERQGDLFNRSLQSTLRESIEEELESVFPGALAALRPAPESDDVPGPISMALLDVDEIEQHLLIDRIAQSFNTRYDANLQALTQCLATLLRVEDLSFADNPFRPAILLRGFAWAWRKSEFDPQAAEDFVSVLELRHCVNWTPLYADLTETLVRSGFSARSIAPRIKRPVQGDPPAAPLHPSGGAGAAAATSSGALEGGAPAPARAGALPQGGAAPASDATLGIAARARQFLQKLGFGRPAGGAAAGGSAGGGAGDGAGADAQVAAHAPADPGLMGFLGGLQAGAVAVPFTTWGQGQDLGGQNLLRQMRERDEVKQATELDRGTIDALAEVFDYVFADSAIPLQLKYVIGRLQIPVLKAAMIDRDFFLSGEHPARKLVDALAAASVAWMPDKGERDPLYAKVDSTVQRVLNEFNDDLGLFADLLAQFNAFLQETEQQAQVQIAPAATQAQSGEALELAQAHADEVVHQCVNALSEALVPFLLPFLARQWREVMARAWLNRAREPALWDDVLGTMDKVIWSTQPKSNPDERAALVAALPDLVRKLNTHLDGIGWSGEERASFTRLLIETHMKAIRSGSRTGQMPLESGPGELETRAGQEAMQALEARRAGSAVEAVDGFDALAQGFTRGLWFEFSVGGDLRRYRLSWVSPKRTRLLFTNRDGFEAFVHSEREVAALLREGRLGVIDQQPIVARAIGQIMAAATPSQLDMELV